MQSQVRFSDVGRCAVEVCARREVVVATVTPVLAKRLAKPPPVAAAVLVARARLNGVVDTPQTPMGDSKNVKRSKKDAKSSKKEAKSARKQAKVEVEEHGAAAVSLVWSGLLGQLFTDVATVHSEAFREMGQPKARLDAGTSLELQAAGLARRLVDKVLDFAATTVTGRKFSELLAACQAERNEAILSSLITFDAAGSGDDALQKTVEFLTTCDHYYFGLEAAHIKATRLVERLDGRIRKLMPLNGVLVSMLERPDGNQAVGTLVKEAVVRYRATTKNQGRDGKDEKKKPPVAAATDGKPGGAGGQQGGRGRGDQGRFQGRGQGRGYGGGVCFVPGCGQRHSKADHILMGLPMPVLEPRGSTPPSSGAPPQMQPVPQQNPRRRRCVSV